MYECSQFIFKNNKTYEACHKITYERGNLKLNLA
jgi:hypothetical protein